MEAPSEQEKETKDILADDQALQWISKYTKFEIDGPAYRALVRAFLEFASRLFTDSSGRTWCVMEREDKSVSIYYTIANSPAHYVVFDSLDAGLDEAEAADDTP